MRRKLGSFELLATAAFFAFSVSCVSESSVGVDIDSIPQGEDVANAGEVAGDLPRSDTLGHRDVSDAGTDSVIGDVLSSDTSCDVLASDQADGDSAGGDALLVDQADGDSAGGDPEPPAIPTIGLGEDYTLPVGVEADAYSGYVGNPQDLGTITVKAYYMRWRLVEPTLGDYAFDIDGSINDLKGALESAAAGGYRLSIFTPSITTRIQYWDSAAGAYDPTLEQNGAAPDWIATDTDIPQTRLEGWLPWHITYVKPDHPTVIAAYYAMIEMFGDFITTNNYWDQIAAVYVHGISPSRGEEFWGNQQTTEELEAAFGFSPVTAQTWLESRFAAFSAAFAGHTRVLSWVGGGYSFVTSSGNDYWGLGATMNGLAWDAGMGNRSGIVERYNLHTQDLTLGQSVDDDGYIYTDDTIPPLADGRYFGDENEEYGENWSWRYGVDHSSPRRYRLSVLRSLQRQYRFLWTSHAAETLNPALSEYARLSFGKTVLTSPDAWAYLMESTVLPWISPACIHYCSGAGGTPVHVLRNMERWLTQRDVPGGVTVPTELTVRSFDAGGSRDPAEQWHDYGSDANRSYFDYLARRTNGAENPYIYFDLDDRFEVLGGAEIKVEYLDDNLAEWHLEYTDGLVLRQTAEVVGVASGEVKTATFAIGGIDSNGNLIHDMDIRIVRNDPVHEVTVRWIRVVRLQP